MKINFKDFSYGADLSITLESGKVIEDVFFESGSGKNLIVYDQQRDVRMWIQKSKIIKLTKVPHIHS